MRAKSGWLVEVAPMLHRILPRPHPRVLPLAHTPHPRPHARARASRTRKHHRRPQRHRGRASGNHARACGLPLHLRQRAPRALKHRHRQPNPGGAVSATIIAPRDGGEPQGKPDSQDGEAVNTPDRQARQLAAIRDLGALERIGDPVLTALTRLARTITGAASAAVHILDDELQHRIAASGIALEDHPVNDSFCRLVVAGNQDVVTRDATTDGRFDYSPFVRDPVNPIRFYAAVPLHSATGVPIGTICAFDSQVRELDPEQLARLEDLAGLALAHLELMRVAAELGRAATLDPLTGATNRTIFDDRLAQALARRRRHGSKVLLAVLDLDDF